MFSKLKKAFSFIKRRTREISGSSIVELHDVEPLEYSFDEEGALHCDLGELCDALTSGASKPEEFGAGSLAELRQRLAPEVFERGQELHTEFGTYYYSTLEKSPRGKAISDSSERAGRSLPAISEQEVSEFLGKMRRLDAAGRTVDAIAFGRENFAIYDGNYMVRKLEEFLRWQPSDEPTDKARDDERISKVAEECGLDRNSWKGATEIHSYLMEKRQAATLSCNPSFHDVPGLDEELDEELANDKRIIEEVESLGGEVKVESGFASVVKMPEGPGARYVAEQLIKQSDNVHRRSSFAKKAAAVGVSAAMVGAAAVAVGQALDDDDAGERVASLEKVVDSEPDNLGEVGNGTDLSELASSLSRDKAASRAGDYTRSEAEVYTIVNSDVNNNVEITPSHAFWQSNDNNMIYSYDLETGETKEVGTYPYYEVEKDTVAGDKDIHWDAIMCKDIVSGEEKEISIAEEDDTSFIDFFSDKVLYWVGFEGEMGWQHLRVRTTDGVEVAAIDGIDEDSTDHALITDNSLVYGINEGYAKEIRLLDFDYGIEDVVDTSLGSIEICRLDDEYLVYLKDGNHIVYDMDAGGKVSILLNDESGTRYAVRDGKLAYNAGSTLYVKDLPNGDEETINVGLTPHDIDIRNDKIIVSGESSVEVVDLTGDWDFPGAVQGPEQEKFERSDFEIIEEPNYHPVSSGGLTEFLEGIFGIDETGAYIDSTIKVKVKDNVESINTLDVLIGEGDNAAYVSKKEWACTLKETEGGEAIYETRIIYEISSSVLSTIFDELAGKVTGGGTPSFDDVIGSTEVDILDIFVDELKINGGQVVDVDDHQLEEIVGSDSQTLTRPVNDGFLGKIGLGATTTAFCPVKMTITYPDGSRVDGTFYSDPNKCDIQFAILPNDLENYKILIEGEADGKYGVGVNVNNEQVFFAKGLPIQNREANSFSLGSDGVSQIEYDWDGDGVVDAEQDWDSYDSHMASSDKLDYGTSNLEDKVDDTDDTTDNGYSDDDHQDNDQDTYQQNEPDRSPSSEAPDVGDGICVATIVGLLVAGGIGYAIKKRSDRNKKTGFSYEYSDAEPEYRQPARDNYSEYGNGLGSEYSARGEESEYSIRREESEYSIRDEELEDRLEDEARYQEDDTTLDDWWENDVSYQEDDQDRYGEGGGPSSDWSGEDAVEQDAVEQEDDAELDDDWLEEPAPGFYEPAGERKTDVSGPGYLPESSEIAAKQGFVSPSVESRVPSPPGVFWRPRSERSGECARVEDGRMESSETDDGWLESPEPNDGWLEENTPTFYKPSQ